MKHLGPVWMASQELMKLGLENWYADMQKNGLAPNGSNEMEEFIYRGIRISNSEKT
jgi:hypothetical protein